jgi:CBS-domain-containing membrane protein
MGPMNVKEIMTAPVITAGPEATVAEIAELLVRHRISGVPVIDAAGSMIGLVSEHDLLARRGETAAEVMTAEVITVDEQVEVDDVRQLLVERRIRRVPVVAAGRLAGIVSRSDVVATLTMEWVCRVCGESVRGSEPPPICPRCRGGRERFARQEQAPGS